MDFDLRGFYAALDQRRKERGLSWSGVSRETGLCPQAMHRMKRGYTPRVDSLLTLSGWLGTPGDLRPYVKPKQP